MHIVTDWIALTFETFTTTMAEETVECFFILDFSFGAVAVDVNHVGFPVQIGPVVDFLALLVCDGILFAADDFLEDIFGGIADGVDATDEQLICLDEFFDALDFDDLKTVFLFVLDRFVIHDLLEVKFFLFYLLLVATVGLLRLHNSACN